MVIFVDETIEFLLDADRDEPPPKDFRRRQKEILGTLYEWRRCGEAELKRGEDGKLRWCATAELRRRLKEEEREMLAEHDD